jgi:hypothetical protein
VTSSPNPSPGNDRALHSREGFHGETKKHGKKNCIKKAKAYAQPAIQYCNLRSFPQVNEIGAPVAVGYPKKKKKKKKK